MQPQQQVPALAQFIPLLLVMVIFYFLLIRPQKKQEDRTVTLRIDDNVKIEVDREAIARIAKVAG